LPSLRSDYDLREVQMAGVNLKEPFPRIAERRPHGGYRIFGLIKDRERLLRELRPAGVSGEYKADSCYAIPDLCSVIERASEAHRAPSDSARSALGFTAELRANIRHSTR
jgi:hypothetical protein